MEQLSYNGSPSYVNRNKGQLYLIAILYPFTWSKPPGTLLDVLLLLSPYYQVQYLLENAAYYHQIYSLEGSGGKDQKTGTHSWGWLRSMLKSNYAIVPPAL